MDESFDASEPERTDSEDMMRLHRKTSMMASSVSDEDILQLKFPTLYDDGSDLENAECGEFYDDSSDCSTLFTPCSSIASLDDLKCSLPSTSAKHDSHPVKPDEILGISKECIFESDSDGEDGDVDQHLGVLATAAEQLRDLALPNPETNPTSGGPDHCIHAKPNPSRSKRTISIDICPPAHPGVRRYEVTRWYLGRTIPRDENCGRFLPQLEAQTNSFPSPRNPSLAFSSRDNAFWQKRNRRRAEVSWWAYIKGALPSFVNLRKNPGKVLKADEIAGKIDMLTCQSLGMHRGTRIAEERKRRAAQRVARIC